MLKTTSWTGLKVDGKKVHKTFSTYNFQIVIFYHSHDEIKIKAHNFQSTFYQEKTKTFNI